MYPETIQLEKLRQRIEDVSYESAMQSEMRDRSKLSPAEAKKANETISKLDAQEKALQAEFKQLIANVRSQNPQAFEEWINYHTGILQKILAENSTDKMAAPRRLVATQTLEGWEKVRAGGLEHISINWYFLKDYKAEVRTITGGAKPDKNMEQPAGEKKKGKAWWPFGK